MGKSRMNLGGHELDIKLFGDNFYIENCTITNGSIKVSEVTGDMHYVCFIDGGGSTLTGTLKPVSGTVGGVTMQDGATLDLSALSDAFSLDDNAISFADGATIYVDVGSRKTRASTPVVSWTAAPPNIGGLRFIAKGDGGEHRLHVKDDGLYYNDGFVIIIY